MLVTRQQEWRQDLTTVGRGELPYVGPEARSSTAGLWVVDIPRTRVILADLCRSLAQLLKTPLTIPVHDWGNNGTFIRGIRTRQIFFAAWSLHTNQSVSFPLLFSNQQVKFWLKKAIESLNNEIQTCLVDEVNDSQCGAGTCSCANRPHNWGG